MNFSCSSTAVKFKLIHIAWKVKWNTESILVQNHFGVQNSFEARWDVRICTRTSANRNLHRSCSEMYYLTESQTLYSTYSVEINSPFINKYVWRICKFRHMKHWWFLKLPIHDTNIFSSWIQSPHQKWIWLK